MEPKCPDCKVEMIPIGSYYDTIWKCPKCKIEIDEEDLEEDNENDD